MTVVDFTSQSSMAAASLLCDEQREHRHDAPARHTKLVPGVECMAGDGRRVATRVHAPESTQAGHDGRSPAPTPITGWFA